MNLFNIPEEKKIRVIVDTDAKNEVDDQFAIVQAVLSESFDLRGIIAEHFGNEKSSHSELDSYNEIKHCLDLMNLSDSVRVYHGAEHKLENKNTPVKSEGAEFIISEALKETNKPLYIACMGAITNVASALLMNPEIAERIIVVWIGGRDYPSGGWEYNLKNDITAAQIVFKSKAPLWQIPRNVYRMMPVSFAELKKRVYPCGKIGEYLCDNVIRFNNEGEKRPTEYRVLGDSPSVGVLLYEDCGEWEKLVAPDIEDDMSYSYNENNKIIRVYKNIDSRFILEDLYSKLELFTETLT